MKRAKLKFSGKAIEFGEGVVTLGRVADNAVAFPHDSNVSRYHAEIEARDGGEFWLIDLKSSNGTLVNDRRFDSEKLLNHGDVILLGGTSKIEFLFAETTEKAAENPAAGSAPPAAGQSKEPKADKDSKPASKLGVVLIIAGIAVGLAVIFVIAAVIFSYTRTTKCEAKANITKPEAGETITELTEIEVETKDADCATRAIFLLNGAEFADATEQPFTATIDPKQFPELANGSLQSLKVVLEDAEGNKIVQPDEIALAFETIEIAAPSPTPEEIVKGATPAPQNKTGKNVSVIETQEISKRLVKEFSGSFNYKTSNPQFLQEVQKKTNEYAAAEGYFARAQAYKDVINVSFVQEQNLDAPLGYILAMSRSQFRLQKGAGEGLWQMDAGFAAGNSYTALCGAENLSDASQNCAAKATALYLKALILGVFEGDTVYAVAAFGKSPQEASIWKESLPVDRSDFWNVIKDAKQREQVVRFFAAGAVAENPQKFGLKKDRPISELYRTLMSK